MFIGKAARRSGATVKAIRHYEKLGLLSPVSRSGRYRVFSDSDVRRIQLIKQAQKLGFRLAEIHAELEANQAIGSWQALLMIIDRKAGAIEAQMAELGRQRDELRGHARTIRDCLEGDPDCRVDLEISRAENA